MIFDLSAGDILANARRAKAQTGRPILQQLIEIVRLRRGPGKLSAKEYFDYRLFDPDIADADRLTFVGRWAKGAVYQAQDPQWCGVGNDKLLSYLFLAANGLPIPPVLAVYHESRHYPGATLLHSPDAFEAWLRDPGNYPFFAKPAAGAFGEDAYFVVSLDKATDCIVTVNDERLPIAAFAAHHWKRHLGGLVLQQVIRPHPDLVERIGNRVGTARIFTMQSDAGPVIHRAVYRIPTGTNFTDNFSLGSKGNGFATIDIATGMLTDVFSGIGLGKQRIETHPDTGKRLAGFVLPHWDRTLEMVRLGQSALLGLRTLGWDVAFTAGGPVIVEFNTHAGYALLQATGKGLVDKEFRAVFPADPVESRKRHPNINIGTGDRRRRR